MLRPLIKLSQQIIDDLLPKKVSTIVAKSANHVQLLLSPEGEVLFFQHREGIWFPTLRLVHKFPQLGPVWQVISYLRSPNWTRKLILVFNL